jgi:hypothetical protein
MNNSWGYAIKTVDLDSGVTYYCNNEVITSEAIYLYHSKAEAMKAMEAVSEIFNNDEQYCNYEFLDIVHFVSNVGQETCGINQYVKQDPISF